MPPPRWQGDGGVSSLFPLGDPGPFSFFWLATSAGGRVDWLGERAGTECVVENTVIITHTQKKGSGIGPGEESVGASLSFIERGRPRAHRC